MAKKLVVVAHGIGDAQPDFYKKWKKVLIKNHDGRKFEVTGLHWEPVLDKVSEKYPLIPKEAVQQFGLDRLQQFTSSETYEKVTDYIMDVLVYVFEGADMTRYIADTCIEQLAQIVQGRESDTILIGHSLGAAMLPHITWREYFATGVVPYKSMILLASPLGFKSPLTWVGDFLQVLGRVSNTPDRRATLRWFADAWSSNGPDSLHFISNENDIVCSDVMFELGGIKRDLIPVQQGFTPDERHALDIACQGCFNSVAFGSPSPVKILENHDVESYLNTPEFIAIFNSLLQ